MSGVKLIWKKSCDSCRRFKKALDELGVPYVSREMNSSPLGPADFEEIIGSRAVRPFLNTRNAVYRELKLSQNPPERERAIELMVETNNLLKRPVLMVGDERVIGADQLGGDLERFVVTLQRR